MKNSTQLLLLIFLSIVSKAFCQVYDGNLMLSNQNQINSFNYSVITGDLTIDEAVAGNITNLNGLNSLIRVNGGFSIRNNQSLTSLNGLENLHIVGTSTIDFFGEGVGLNIENNNSLTSIASLSDLTSIGSNLYIVNNPSLINLEGLEGIDSMHGNLRISDNPNLTSLNGLNNLETLQGIGFFGGGIEIYNCNSLTNFEGLEGLTTIDASFWVSNNESLLSFAGLNSLTEIIGLGNFTIVGNDSLLDLDGLQNLNYISQDFQIESNNSLLSFNGVNNLQNIGGALLIASNQELETLEGLENLLTIGWYLSICAPIDGFGYVHPGNVSLTSINLNNLVSIGERSGGFLEITGCTSLTSLDGLENLHTIQPEYFYSTGNRLQIGGNYITNPDVSPYSNLANPNLTDYCGIQRLITYEEINSSSGIFVNNGFNPTIDQIANLDCDLPEPSQTPFRWRTAIDNGDVITETLNGITTTFTGENANILDVREIPNQNYIGGGFDMVIEAYPTNSVTFNFSEPVDVISITSISDNNHTQVFTPIGGNNEVVTAILDFGGTKVNLNWQGVTSFIVTTTTTDYFEFDDLRISKNTALSSNEFIESDITIYPNPVEDFLYLENAEKVNSAKVFDIAGKLIFETKEKKINFGDLSSGIYFLQLDTVNGIVTKKIIKK